LTFKQWIRHRGLSDSSVRNYEGAISGVLSDWAIDGGLINGPLTSIQSLSQFESISIGVRKLPIYQKRNERGHSMYNSALNKYAEYLKEGFESDLESDIEEILAERDTTETEKASLLKTRIGQGYFRQGLIGYWGGCAVTGYRDTSMLVASHIKPWRASSNHERLDHYNGLLLLPTLDKAFDSGFISFDVHGKILVSAQLQDSEKLGVVVDMKVKLRPEHQAYMEFHRVLVFRST
jgi:predicted restriction endonuclease